MAACAVSGGWYEVNSITANSCYNSIVTVVVCIAIGGIAFILGIVDLSVVVILTMMLIMSHLYCEDSASPSIPVSVVVPTLFGDGVVSCVSISQLSDLSLLVWLLGSVTVLCVVVVGSILAAIAMAIAAVIRVGVVVVAKQAWPSLLNSPLKWNGLTAYGGDDSKCNQLARCCCC